MARRKSHEVLGVEEDASIEEIRAAFRDGAKEFHPDRMGDAGRARFEEVREAYEELSSRRDRPRRGGGGVDIPVRVNPSPSSSPRRGFVEPLRPFEGSSPRRIDPFGEWLRPLEVILRRFR